MLINTMQRMVDGYSEQFCYNVVTRLYVVRLFVVGHSRSSLNDHS
jgi:hypothetical protein